MGCSSVQAACSPGVRGTQKNTANKCGERQGAHTTHADTAPEWCKQQVPRCRRWPGHITQLLLTATAVRSFLLPQRQRWRQGALGRDGGGGGRRHRCGGCRRRAGQGQAAAGSGGARRGCRRRRAGPTAGRAAARGALRACRRSRDGAGQRCAALEQHAVALGHCDRAAVQQQRDDRDVVGRVQALRALHQRLGGCLCVPAAGESAAGGRHSLQTHTHRSRTKRLSACGRQAHAANKTQQLQP